MATVVCIRKTDKCAKMLVMFYKELLVFTAVYREAPVKPKFWGLKVISMP